MPAWAAQAPGIYSPPAQPRAPQGQEPALRPLEAEPPEPIAAVEPPPAPPMPPVAEAPEPPQVPVPPQPAEPAYEAAPQVAQPTPIPYQGYQPWGGVPYGGWAPAYGGWNRPWGSGWGGNNWMPWGNGWGGNNWGGNSWWPWDSGWGGNNWGGNNWWPWDNGWGGNNWGGSNWAPWGSGWGGDGWNDGYGSGWGNGWGDTRADAAGDGSGEADFSFAMRAWASGDLRGRGDGYGYGDGWGNGYGYQGYAPGYWPPPVAMLPPAPAAEPAGPADGDQDGVVDGTDLCPDSTAGSTVDELGCGSDERIVLRGVHFKTDSDELTDESLAILDGVSETLSAHPQIQVMVAGHTDSDGDDAYNKDLSQRRAQSVVNYLSSQGVDRNNMIAKGYGEEQPIATNDTTEGKAQNRRVELNRL